MSPPSTALTFLSQTKVQVPSGKLCLGHLCLAFPAGLGKYCVPSAWAVCAGSVSCSVSLTNSPSQSSRLCLSPARSCGDPHSSCFLLFMTLALMKMFHPLFVSVRPGYELHQSQIWACLLPCYSVPTRGSGSKMNGEEEGRGKKIDFRKIAETRAENSRVMYQGGIYFLFIHLKNLKDIHSAFSLGEIYS